MIIQQQPSILSDRPQVSSLVKNRRSVSPAEPPYRLAQALVEHRKWEDAIAAYQQALTITPNWVEVQRELGDLFLKLERWDEAVEVYEIAIGLRSDTEVYHNLGEALLKLQRWEDAIAAYQKAIELNPEFSWSYNNLGDGLRELKRWDEAAQAYQKAIELKPDFVWSYYNLGDTFAKLEQWGEAVKFYQNALELNSDLPDIHEKLADMLKLQSHLHLKEAGQQYNLALDKDPENIDIYHKALEIELHNADLYLGLGNALMKQSRFDEAAVFYQMGLKIKPNDYELFIQFWKAILKTSNEFEDMAVKSQADLIDFYCYYKDKNEKETQHSIQDLKVNTSDKTPEIELTLYQHNLINKQSQYSTYKVDIIVCVHNALDDVKQCLQSIIKYTQVNYQLIVIDDGSDWDTRDFLRSWVENYSFVQLIVNEQAQGYTKAANQGLKAGKNDYMILLNSDTIVTPKWVEKLIECCNSQPDIGIVGPLSNCASWQSIPEIIDQKGNWSINLIPSEYTLEEYSYLLENLSNKEFPIVNFVNGFCYLIKGEVIKKIGYLDEHTFPYGYGEENDYSIRANQAGFKLAIADHTYVYHSKSKSFGHERRQELSQKGKIALKDKYPNIDVNVMVEKLKDNLSLKILRTKLKYNIIKLPVK